MSRKELMLMRRGYLLGLRRGFNWAAARDAQAVQQALDERAMQDTWLN
jgi:hypothetical protein